MMHGIRARADGMGPGRPWLRLGRLPTLALAFIVAGLALRVGGAGAAWSGRIWLLGLVVTGAPVAVRTLRGMLAGRFAADIVAMLAIVTAVILREPLPGLIVVLMQTGGEALERFAEGRATDAVRALEADAPRAAHRRVNGRIEEVAAESIAAGDVLLIRPGDVVPCDCVVLTGSSHVDTARLTGEPVPRRAGPGARLMSGSVNQEGALDVRATATAGESQYARIVELVRTAQASKSPLQRMADRYAIGFTPLTLVVAGAAWLVSGDPVRVLAVLVVATPCPLILATPVAIIGGINRAARRQIIVRHGTALEQLGKVNVAVFDKTGTLTLGLPEVSEVVAAEGFTEDDVLQLAGAVELHAGHLLARPVVAAAGARGLDLTEARDVVETPGRGVAGTVAGRVVSVGARSFIAERAPSGSPPADGDGTRAFVAVDGHWAGMIAYADHARAELPAFFDGLRAAGVERTLVLSGDHEPGVRAVAQAIGIGEYHADLLPEDKVRFVRALVAGGAHVLMVGDGINDAPALSSATVGVALAGHGGGIAADAADVVILIDELPRVLEGIRISRRTLRIARQSIGAGLGLSALAMAFAALGYVPPTLGALLQEGIDVAVVLNALRASR